MEDFRLLMISAMYENGGNTTHRFLDGHPQMFVYPFESQLGTRLVQDPLSSVYPAKYRWPQFALDATEEQDYRAIIDEECKVRARTPHVSKFRHVSFDFSDDERAELYEKYVTESGRSRANNVAAFFRATFDAWKDHRRSGSEILYVGYSPIIVVDANKILEDLSQAKILHVVRNPWAAYADTKKRPVPQSLEDYMLGWTLNQFFATRMKSRYKDRVQILRIEDLLDDPVESLGRICEWLGADSSEILKQPSWNGDRLDEVYPWGTIRRATPDANRATAAELSGDEQEQVRLWARQYLDVFNYADFL